MNDETNPTPAQAPAAPYLTHSSEGTACPWGRAPSTPYVVRLLDLRAEVDRALNATSDSARLSAIADVASAAAALERELRHIIATRGGR